MRLSLKKSVRFYLCKKRGVIMKTVTLQNKKISSGSLILVNQSYPFVGEEENLSPACGQVPSVLIQYRAGIFLSNLMNRIDGWRQIVPVSGWRSKQEQEEIWNDSLLKNGQEFTEKYVAVPGCSEHQTGLAIDLGLKQEVIDFICPDFPYSGICQIFREMAAGYGFVQRYPKGKESVTGIGHEPWHFRYVGVPHAMIMKQENLVLEEYIAFIRQYLYGKKSYDFYRGGHKFSVAYLEADKGENTEFLTDDAFSCSVSGNNVDGFVITKRCKCGKRRERYAG